MVRQHYLYAINHHNQTNRTDNYRGVNWLRTDANIRDDEVKYYLYSWIDYWLNENKDMVLILNNRLKDTSSRPSDAEMRELVHIRMDQIND